MPEWVQCMEENGVTAEGNDWRCNSPCSYPVVIKQFPTGDKKRHTDPYMGAFPTNSKDRQGAKEN